jgi:hypothetical protein
MVDIYCCDYALNRKDDAIYEDASHQSATGDDDDDDVVSRQGG